MKDSMIALREAIKETLSRVETTLEQPAEESLRIVAMELQDLGSAFSYTAGYIAALKEVKQIIEGISIKEENNEHN